MDNQKIEQPYTEGERFFLHYEENKHRFTTPIISPAVDFILNRCTLNWIVLFVTDQKPPQPSDTIYLGKIIKKILEEKIRGSQVKLIEIHENPSLYDEMFNFYSMKLNYRIKEWENVFISATGGTPACNFALIFNGIKLFRKKCQILHISEITRKAVPLNCVEQLLKEFDKETVAILAEKYDYSSISEILKGNNKTAYLLSEYARLRLYFDFKSALLISEELIKNTQQEMRRFAEKLREDLDKLIEEKIKDLVCELFINTEIKAKRKEWVDFISRVFRLQEAILRYIVEDELNISTQTGKFKIECEDIKDFLGSKKLEYNAPTIPVLMALLEFIKSNDNKYNSVYENINKISKLANLRNSSIIAHGFRGISEKDFEAEGISPNDILNILTEILNTIEIKIPESTIFDEINKIIIENI